MKSGFVHILVIFLTLLVLSGFIGFRLGKTAQISSKTTQSVSSNSNTTGNEVSSVSYPQVSPEKKNLTLDKDRHYRDPFKITFDDWQNTTYDKIEYKFQGVNYPYYKINLKNTDIYAMMQPGNDKGEKKHLEFVYEGMNVVDHSLLAEELAQNDGVYPRTIYHPEYEIFTNKNGIKMKRDLYSMGPKIQIGGGMKVQFLADYYYQFEVSSVAEWNDQEEKLKITNTQKLQEFNNLIDSIKYQPKI